MLAATGLVLLSTLSPGAIAAPLARRNSGTTTTTAITIPIVVVGIFVVAAIVTFSNGSFRSRIWMWCAGAAVASGTAAAAGAGATELTAEQLAGPPQPGEAQPGRRSNRRNRRERNSVRSTRSLPVYMKEAGTDEVVVFRGPEDLEDTNIRATIILSAVNEGDASPNPSIDLGRTLSHSSEYVQLRDVVSTQNTPLLRGQQSPSPAVEGLPRTSEDITHEDARGPTPAYYEVIDMDTHSGTTDARDVDTPDLSQETVPEISEPDHPAHTRSTSNGLAGGLTGMFAREPSVGGRGGSRRQNSGRLTGLISRLTGSTHAPPMPLRSSRDLTHVRAQSDASEASAASSRVSTAPRRVRHRPSHSGSGSMLSVFRTTSRPRSHSQLDALNSSSTISLHSISSPLTHTAVRTQFTYPSSGPTPEQMKLIASRESLSRFGMPYGPDALAYSQSMLDLSVPPPVFEAVAGGSEEGAESAEHAQAGLEAAGPVEGAPLERLPEGAGQPDDAPSKRNQAEPVDGASQPDTTAEILPTNMAPPSHIEALPTSPVEATSIPQPTVTQAEETIAPLEESKSHNEASSVRTISPAQNESPVETGISTEPASPVEPRSLQNPPKPPLPPSSFKPVLQNSRSVSRASSRADSFATAEESFYTASEPPTPTVFVSPPDLVLDTSGDHLLPDADDDAPPTPRATSSPQLDDDSDDSFLSRRNTVVPAPAPAVAAR